MINTEASDCEQHDAAAGGIGWNYFMFSFMNRVGRSFLKRSQVD